MSKTYSLMEVAEALEGFAVAMESDPELARVIHPSIWKRIALAQTRIFKVMAGELKPQTDNDFLNIGRGLANGLFDFLDKQIPAKTPPRTRKRGIK